MAKRCFWVGLEHKTDWPTGYGEDYREYVTVDEGENYYSVVRAAVLRQADGICFDDGHRIAVHEVKA